MMKSKYEAMVHSVKQIQKVEIIQWNSSNDIIVKTVNGVTCHAIWNPFNGLIYADDLYAVIKEGEERK